VPATVQTFAGVAFVVGSLQLAILTAGASPENSKALKVSWLRADTEAGVVARGRNLVDTGVDVALFAELLAGATLASTASSIVQCFACLTLTATQRPNLVVRRVLVQLVVQSECLLNRIN
jgi:hypothetical protein